MTENDLKTRYETFLNLLMGELNRMFDEQSEFIKCKEGCSYCCEKGEYPFSELEFYYLLDEYETLSEDTKNIIKENIKKVNMLKQEHKDGRFMYDCPFLVNKRCSVYNNRGIICRTFGLLCEHDDGRLTMPFCQSHGLNYSNVFDEELNQIVYEKDGVMLTKTEPKAYRISRDNIMNLSTAKRLNIEWGKSKTLIDFINECDIFK